MERYGVERIKINGFYFDIGYTADCEFSGYVCAIWAKGEMHGVLAVDENHREIGWDSGLYATDEQLEAIKIAKKVLFEKYGRCRTHG